MQSKPVRPRLNELHAVELAGGSQCCKLITEAWPYKHKQNLLCKQRKMITRSAISTMLLPHPSSGGFADTFRSLLGSSRQLNVPAACLHNPPVALNQMHTWIWGALLALQNSVVA